MPAKKLPQKKYANVGNPTINAVLKSLYRFATEQQALDRITQLKEYFVSSKHSESPNTAVIWVRGYEVTKEEKVQGYTGNYTIISCKKEEDKYTLTAVKLASELRFHPQRERPKQKHPDWGHPILRDIKKKRIYFSIEEAADELMRLHEQFPEVSIPDEHRLMIILYEKTSGVKSPVQKYKFEVKAIPDGGFFIAFKRNNKPAKSKDASSQAADVSGYFATMVKLKKRKKPVKSEQ